MAWNVGILSQCSFEDGKPTLFEMMGLPEPLAKEQTGDEMDAMFAKWAVATAHLEPSKAH